MDSRINVPNSSRSYKNNPCDLIDRMSGLPDSILGVILSFLPTKEAVATTILSKRWKLVWTTVHNLDFLHDDCWKGIDENKDMKFIQFVNRVLLLHDAGYLNKFTLVWHCCISSHATSWISTAITRKVHELSLDLNGFFGYFDMPISVFCCDSLRSLEFHGAISVSASIEFCLPKLESLILISVYFESEAAFERLINSCPMLNYLYLYMNDEEEATFTYILTSASLRRLELQLMPAHNLILEASSLEYLKLGGYQISVQKSLSSLVEVDFCIDLFGDEIPQADLCNSVVGTVRKFDYAKALNLSADVMWALSCGTISLSTEFNRLVKLETSTYFCSCSSLQYFIQYSENLEVLTIHKDYVYVGNEYLHDHSKWTPPVEVPRCLSNTLMKVVINGYEGLEDEREMIRYLLGHGSVLEVMHISFAKDTYGEKTELIQEICEFPRKSVACKVKELSNLHAR